MSYTQKKPNMHISYGGESVQQHKKNLINDNPLAKHASAIQMQEDQYDTPFHLIDGKKKKKDNTSEDIINKPFKGGRIDISKSKKEELPSDSKSKPTDSKPSAPKYKSGSEGRKAEYDAKGWKYDDTIKGYNRDGSKKATSTPAPVSTTGSETIKAKEVLKTAKSDAKEGQAGRQDTRKAKRISKRANRVSKREDIRKGRQAAKDAGLKGKAKRDAIKTAKAAAKKKQREANK